MGTNGFDQSLPRMNTGPAVPQQGCLGPGARLQWRWGNEKLFGLQLCGIRKPLFFPRNAQLSTVQYLVFGGQPGCPFL